MTAFRATYSDFKFIKTRDAVQIIFEVPRHDADAALEILGGMPTPSSERWFGIAPLTAPASAMPQPGSDKPPAGAKRDWRELPPSQQAGIRINEPAFSAYLKENHPDEWHETGDADACLKLIFRIESKTELKTSPKTMMLWRQLDDHYQAWKALEHA
jgi:hypothetical protein